MADLLNYDAAQLLVFILVLVRVSGIIATAPVLGSNSIPMQVRVVLALVLALILQPFTPALIVYPDQPSEYLLLIAGELLIGLVLGMVGQILFAAVEFAGTVVGFQMGLSMANVFDPQSQAQISLIGQFERIFATLIFVAMDGHLVVVQAIVRSYDLLPPGGANFSDSLTQEMIRLSAGVFTLGFQLGAPLITALFLANLTMALLARSVPQIQIFIVGFPLTLLLGFMVLMFGVPFFAQALHRMFEMYDDQLLNMLRILALPGAP